MATERIYTITYFDETPDGIERFTVGSYRTFDRAVEECIDYIFDRLDDYKAMCYSFYYDDNHADAKKFMGDNKDGYKTVTDEAGLREYIRAELYDQQCYHVDDARSWWYFFDIDENDIED